MPTPFVSTQDIVSLYFYARCTPRPSVIQTVSPERRSGLLVAGRVLGTVLLATALSGPAGNAAHAASRQLEEVVVTAQKREESLQNVPISMAVVSGEQLRAVNVFDFTETEQLTPGVSFFPSVQGAAIRLRGVGPGSFALTSPQSVSVFIDDIAQGSVGAAFATLVDIERIELLRGPQGTLYGQNAPGGAYNISTRAPSTTEYQGYVEGSYALLGSSDRDSVDIRGAVNFPLVDETLGLRIAGVYADSDGYLEVRNPQAGADSTAGKEHYALRSRLLWIIDERSDLTWTSNYQDLSDRPVDFNIDGIVPGTGAANPVPAVVNEFEDRKWYGDFLDDAQTDLLDTSVHYRRSMDWTNLEFLASWQDFDTWQLDNRQPFPGRSAEFAIQLDWETKTAELRFSDTGDTFDYIGGVYYAVRDIDGFFDVDLSGTALTGPATGQGDSKAIYANVTWHVTQDWDFTAGARYQKNDVWTKSNFEFLGFNSIVDGRNDWEHPSWSLKLRHYLNEHTTLYVALDHAYKQGGFNNLMPGLLALEPVFPELGDVGREMLSFDQETSTAFEVGAKGTALDSRLSYSIAVFYQEFDDHQIAQPGEVRALETPLGDLNALFAAQLVNAEEVNTKGVEVELFYLLGEAWDVSLRTSYFDASIEQWDYRFCPPGDEQTPDQLFCPADSGAALNNLPPLSSNFQLGHTRPLSADWLAYGRFNWTWYSEPNGGVEFEQYKTDKNIIGLTVGLTSPSSGLDIRLWGKNLTNTDRNVDPSQRSDGDPSLPQPFSGRHYPGREYGVTVNYTF